jgi:hypothetical protein
LDSAAARCARLVPSSPLGSPGVFLLGVAIDAGLSLLVFRHADRQGSRQATAWGISSLLFAGIAFPAYFIRYALRWRG